LANGCSLRKTFRNMTGVCYDGWWKLANEIELTELHQIDNRCYTGVQNLVAIKSRPASCSCAKFDACLFIWRHQQKKGSAVHPYEARRSIVPITADVIPERDITLEALSTTQSWFEELDPAVRDGFDEGTEEFAICHIVAEVDVAVAPELSGIFAAFDQVSGRRFSDLLASTQQMALQVDS
jgi:hypothetical protein